jgi:phage-related protein
MNYFILDGWNITAEEGIYLIDSGQERSNKPRFESEQSYGANGNVNIFEEAFDTYSRTFTFQCNSREKMDLLISRFYGTDMKLELWTRPDHFIYIDFKNTVPVKRLADNQWQCKFQCDVQPFKYLKNSPNKILTSNGSIENIGNWRSEPRIIVEGNGNTTLTIGKQVMTLNIDTILMIECKHRHQQVLDKNNQLAISRTRGGFFEIEPGINGVVLGAGITKVTIEPRWRIR